MIHYEYKIEDIIYNITGRVGVVVARRCTETKGGCDITYFIDFGEFGESWVDEVAIFKDKPAHAL